MLSPVHFLSSFQTYYSQPALLFLACSLAFIFFDFREAGVAQGLYLVSSTPKVQLIKYTPSMNEIRSHKLGPEPPLKLSSMSDS